MNGADTDVVIIGAGPAGLSAALNLARARRRVMLIDSNRPRNSATLLSHGYLTRDGITPHELRRLGRKELTAYPGVEHHLGHVERVSRVEGGFEIEASRVNASPDRTATAPVVLIATGLKETLPALPSILSYYGIGLLIAQWSRDLTVFTNGVAPIGEAQEALLACW